MRKDKTAYYSHGFQPESECSLSILPSNYTSSPASYNPTDEAQAAKMAAARETYDDPMTAIELQEGHSHRRHSPLHQEGDVSSPPPQYDDLVFLPTTQTSSEAK